MVDNKHIRLLLEKYFQTGGNVTIDKMGLVSCAGRVEISGTSLTKLPVQFKTVHGDFICVNNKLTTLEGVPSTVRGSFWCQVNQLKTLEHAPKTVGGHFACNDNQLTTLAGAPSITGDNFFCFSNPLDTLEGLPAVPGTLWLTYSSNLPLLRCLLAKEIRFWPEVTDPRETEKATTVQQILNKNAGKGKRMIFDAQKELEDAGFAENARW